MALQAKWRRHPAAQCWLWKDHTSWSEAAKITALAAEHRPDFTAKCGKAYSSEWWWSKLWHCLQTAPEVFEAAWSWTVLVDPLLSGLIAGCTLHTTRAEIYRALVEATAFGARVIIERLKDYGVPIERVVCAGGIADKNRLLMQIYADVTGCTMLVAQSGQACALGAAVAAAVRAGVFADFPSAQRAMTGLKKTRYRPNPANRKIYDRLYALYLRLHDGFGGRGGAADYSGVMKDLLKIKSAA